MASVEIVPITQDHIESFHRALDFVARERRYLSFLEAPPLESVREFILNNIKQGYPQLVAVSASQVVGWCDSYPTNGRFTPMLAFSAWACCRNSGGVGWAMA